jgi:hypothetical protein
MSPHEIEQLSYPIGKMPIEREFSFPETQENINKIILLPEQLNAVFSIISSHEMQYTYRPGAWNIAQLIHHIADSHINIYTRFKLALTEDQPTIKPYDENLWAELPDAKSQHDISYSVMMITGIHYRLGAFLNNLNEEQLQRCIFHPEQNKLISIARMCQMYGWHGEHHVAQIKTALQKKFLN